MEENWANYKDSFLGIASRFCINLLVVVDFAPPLLC